MRPLVLSAVWSSLILVGCAGADLPLPQAVPELEATPAPSWIWQLEYSEARMCGLGVAGPGFPGSPYPRENATERAVLNLAGSIETAVQEALISVQRESGTSVRLQRLLEVDSGLLNQVRSAALVEYWVDALGEGPFQQAGFTYALACVDSKAVDGAEAMSEGLRSAIESLKAEGHSAKEQTVPKWLNLTGTQPGGRLCAIGYSEPAFYADQTFANVVESIRGQLAETLQTLVSEYQQEFVGDAFALNEVMTAASSKALSEGVVVTHYWYDVSGEGPYAKRGTTYGWGCTYPSRVLTAAVAEAAEVLPPEAAEILSRVRERAELAFDELERVEAAQDR